MVGPHSLKTTFYFPKCFKTITSKSPGDVMIDLSYKTIKIEIESIGGRESKTKRKENSQSGKKRGKFQ